MAFRQQQTERTKEASSRNLARKRELESKYDEYRRHRGFRSCTKTQKTQRWYKGLLMMQTKMASWKEIHQQGKERRRTVQKMARRAALTDRCLQIAYDFLASDPSVVDEKENNSKCKNAADEPRSMAPAHDAQYATTEGVGNQREILFDVLATRRHDLYHTHRALRHRLQRRLHLTQQRSSFHRQSESLPLTRLWQQGLEPDTVLDQRNSTPFNPPPVRKQQQEAGQEESQQQPTYGIRATPSFFGGVKGWLARCHRCYETMDSTQIEILIAGPGYEMAQHASCDQTRTEH